MPWLAVRLPSVAAKFPRRPLACYDSWRVTILHTEFDDGVADLIIHSCSNQPDSIVIVVISFVGDNLHLSTGDRSQVYDSIQSRPKSESSKGKHIVRSVNKWSVGDQGPRFKTFALRYGCDRGGRYVFSVGE